MVAKNAVTDYIIQYLIICFVMVILLVVVESCGILFIITSVSWFMHTKNIHRSIVSKLTITDSDNGLSPDRRQAIIWTNAGLLVIGPLGANFSGMLIEIYRVSVKKHAFENVVWQWPPFCLGFHVLTRLLYIIGIVWFGGCCGKHNSCVVESG